MVGSKSVSEHRGARSSTEHIDGHQQEAATCGNCQPPSPGVENHFLIQGDIWGGWETCTSGCGVTVGGTRGGVPIPCRKEHAVPPTPFRLPHARCPPECCYSCPPDIGAGGEGDLCATVYVRALCLIQGGTATDGVTPHPPPPARPFYAALAPAPAPLPGPARRPHRIGA